MSEAKPKLTTDGEGREEKVSVRLSQLMRACVVLQPSDRSDDFDTGAKWVTQKIMSNLHDLFLELSKERAS